MNHNIAQLYCVQNKMYIAYVSLHIFVLVYCTFNTMCKMICLLHIFDSCIAHYCRSLFTHGLMSRFCMAFASSLCPAWPGWPHSPALRAGQGWGSDPYQTDEEDDAGECMVCKIKWAIFLEIMCRVQYCAIPCCAICANSWQIVFNWNNWPISAKSVQGVQYEFKYSCLSSVCQNCSGFVSKSVHICTHSVSLCSTSCTIFC